MWVTGSVGSVAEWSTAWVVETRSATVAMASVDDVDSAAVAASARRLSSEEKARAASIPREMERVRFQVGRLLLRALAGQVLGVEPTRLSVTARCPDCGGPHGAPVLVGGPAGAAVNVSYSGAIVAVAVSADVPVGVDVETPVARSRELAELAVSDAGGGGTAVDPLRQWTRVEAVLKADGRGLRLDHSAVSFQRRGIQLAASVPAAHGRGRSSFAVMDLDMTGSPYPDVIASLATASSH